MEKRKLWIYGCSFSQRFYPTIVNVSWPEIISKHFDLELINKSYGGWGWNFIKDSIDKDFIKWSKDDLILISPSYFTRLSVMEMKDPFGVSSKSEWLVDLIDHMDLYRMSENRWRNTVINLLHCGYNVWTWPWNETEYSEDIPTIIPNPQTKKKEKSWIDWNKNTKEFWCKPYRHRCDRGIWIDGDTHFNDDGHMFIAEHMLKYIKYK